MRFELTSGWPLEEAVEFISSCFEEIGMGVVEARSRHGGEEAEGGPSWSVRVGFPRAEKAGLEGARLVHVSRDGGRAFINMTAPVGAFYSRYVEQEFDLALRIEAVSKCLLKNLQAVYVDAQGEYAERVWFAGDQREWHGIQGLRVERCEESVCEEEGHVWRWVGESGAPVRVTGEGYRFLEVGKGSGLEALLGSCPICGCEWSSRAELPGFGCPTEEMVGRVRRVGWRWNDLGQVAREIGPADQVLRGLEMSESERELGYFDVGGIAVYWDLLEECVVLFKELCVGQIIVNFAGKRLE